jgi:hypothetical protein
LGTEKKEKIKMATQKIFLEMFRWGRRLRSLRGTNHALRVGVEGFFRELELVPFKNENPA